MTWTLDWHLRRNISENSRTEETTRRERRHAMHTYGSRPAPSSFSPSPPSRRPLVSLLSLLSTVLLLLPYLDSSSFVQGYEADAAATDPVIITTSTSSSNHDKAAVAPMDKKMKVRRGQGCRKLWKEGGKGGRYGGDDNNDDNYRGRRNKTATHCKKKYGCDDGGGDGGGDGGDGGDVGVGGPPPGGLLPDCVFALDPSSDCSASPPGTPPPGECTRQNFGYDCAFCTRFCPVSAGIPMSYDLPTYDLTYFGTTVNNNHGCQIRNQIPESTVASVADLTKLGNFCCQPCFLWRDTNPINCPFLLANDLKQCWVNKDLNGQGTQPGNQPYVRRTDTEPALSSYQHFLMIPDRAITGVEDRFRNTYDVWAGAWEVYRRPNNQLLKQPSNNKFWSQVNTNWPGYRDTGMGVNMANARSQHQMHIHYAPLPKPLRDFLKGGPTFTNPTTQCTPLSIVANGKRISFGAYFFASPFGSPQAIQWNPRQLASRCASWQNDLVPLFPGPIGTLWDADDLRMAATSMMVVAANTADQSQGYYLLFGNIANNNRFRAEDMLCTTAAIDNPNKAYWTKNDCP